MPENIGVWFTLTGELADEATLLNLRWQNVQKVLTRRPDAMMDAIGRESSNANITVMSSEQGFPTAAPRQAPYVRDKTLRSQ